MTLMEYFGMVTKKSNTTKQKICILEKGNIKGKMAKILINTSTTVEKN